MTTFEHRLANLKLQWVWHSGAFTTVHNGFGFGVYYRNDRNWLAVLDPEITAIQLQIHRTEPPALTAFWKGSRSVFRLFEVPVSDDFLTHVVESAFPEMLSL